MNAPTRDAARIRSSEAVEDQLCLQSKAVSAPIPAPYRLTPVQPNKGVHERSISTSNTSCLRRIARQNTAITAKTLLYDNLVACWPRPNCGFEPAYGARKKGSWPSVPEQPQFISPLRGDCSARFAYNHRGEISVAQMNDAAANETIDRLGLKHPELTALGGKRFEVR